MGVYLVRSKYPEQTRRTDLEGGESERMWRATQKEVILVGFSLSALVKSTYWTESHQNLRAARYRVDTNLISRIFRNLDFLVPIDHQMSGCLIFQQNSVEKNPTFSLQISYWLQMDLSLYSDGPQSSSFDMVRGLLETCAPTVIW